MKKLKKEKGFTLIELIVVIAILAILSSVSIGGFEYSQKRAAIENDKALVNQLNRVLDSYGIFTHDKEKISTALIEEFGKSIDVESNRFNYDIYCYIDLCEFYLLENKVYDNNPNYIKLKYYLSNTEQNPNKTEIVFLFNDNYSQKLTNDEKTKKLFVRTAENLINVGIYINDAKDLFAPTIKLNDIISAHTKLYNKPIDFNFTCELIRDVGYYPNNTSKHFEISNNTIKFNVPGIYQIIFFAQESTYAVSVNVSNVYLNGLSLNKINISADHNQIKYNISKNISHNNQNNSISLEISELFQNILITDFSKNDFSNLDNLNLLGFPDYINYVEIIVALGELKQITPLSINSTSYLFVFDNLDISNPNKILSIKYRYLASDGNWYFSDTFTITIDVGE